MKTNDEILDSARAGLHYLIEGKPVWIKNQASLALDILRKEALDFLRKELDTAKPELMSVEKCVHFDECQGRNLCCNLKSGQKICKGIC